MHRPLTAIERIAVGIAVCAPDQPGSVVAVSMETIDRLRTTLEVQGINWRALRAEAEQTQQGAEQ